MPCNIPLPLKDVSVLFTFVFNHILMFLRRPGNDNGNIYIANNEINNLLNYID